MQAVQFPCDSENKKIQKMSFSRNDQTSLAHDSAGVRGGKEKAITKQKY